MFWKPVEKFTVASRKTGKQYSVVVDEQIRENGMPGLRSCWMRDQELEELADPLYRQNGEDYNRISPRTPVSREPQMQ